MKQLVLFVKQPLPGRVKTRLASSIGDALAAELYAASTADLVARFRGLADGRTLAFAPDDDSARDHFANLAAGDYALWPQPDVDLGGRLAACCDRVFADGAERVVIVGTDSPLLSREDVTAAFDVLAERDCVLGPATDGGYWLVGLRRPLPEVFRDVRWSTPHVLADTIARLAEAGASLGLLPVSYDVDALGDLLALRGHVAALRAAGVDPELPWLEPLLADDRIDAAIDAATGL